MAAAWQKGGGTVVPGLEMLLYQAVEQVRFFTGREDAASAEVIDVMCDAVGAPRRVL
jgi:shikimate dehydrogenase